MYNGFTDLLLTVNDISKQFHGVFVLKNFNFSVKRGEVHAIIGENGAGKSTLVKILSGVIPFDNGEVLFNNEIIKLSNPAEAQKLGISTIYQERNLFLDQTVAENIFSYRKPLLLRQFHIIDWNTMYKQSEQILDWLGFRINPRGIVGTLGESQKQMIEIARALSRKSKLIIMDEPTTALTDHEVSLLFEAIEKLKEKGISIIYISHRIEEVFRICDRLTVIRDGENISTMTVNEAKTDHVISLMAGKDIKDRYPKLKVDIGRTVLKIKEVSTDKGLNNISLSLHKGEVLGITGLAGSGRTAVARAIFGIDRIVKGEIILNGSRINIRSPEQAIKHRIGFVTSNRIEEGLVGQFGIAENITLANLRQISWARLLRLNRERWFAKDYIDRLVIKPDNLNQKVIKFSGGNQQKIILSKWLFSESSIIIFDEPTAGIDMGSKVEVYNLMNELVRTGSSLIIISSDLSEILGMSDRIMVMFNGTIRKELLRNQASQSKILYYASGGLD